MADSDPMMSEMDRICGTDAGGAISGEDQFFLVIMGSLVFFMQAGFALLEAGSTGVYSVTSILFKNVADVFVGAIAWFAVGYAIAYGDDGSEAELKMFGRGYYFMHNVGLCEYANWFYQWTFAATAVTIVSGAMAGRTQLKAYIVYSTIITAFVYPTIVHWTWSGNAWLASGNFDDDQVGYSDFAGSGIVHMTGGVAALVGAYFVGPRGTTVFENYADKAEIPGHSMPLVALGTFILFFGFIGFNGGSVLSADQASMPIMGLAVVNTVMAASGGGVMAEAINMHGFRRNHFSLMQMCNGGIAGMVSICAGANVVYPWAAFVIGMGGGAAFKLTSHLVHRAQIDDAIDAAAVHMGPGFWGLIAVAFFAMDPADEPAMTHDFGGIFYGGGTDAWNRLGWNVAGGLVILVWTGTLTSIIFFALNKFGMLRTCDSKLNALGGLDFAEHGEMAYVYHAVSNAHRHDVADTVLGSAAGVPVPRGSVQVSGVL